MNANELLRHYSGEARLWCLGRCNSKDAGAHGGGGGSSGSAAFIVEAGGMYLKERAECDVFQL